MFVDIRRLSLTYTTSPPTSFPFPLIFPAIPSTKASLARDPHTPHILPILSESHKAPVISISIITTLPQVQGKSRSKADGLGDKVFCVSREMFASLRLQLLNTQINYFYYSC